MTMPFTQTGLMRNVKAKVFDEVDAATLEAAINTFLNAGTGALVSIAFSNSSTGLAALVLYSE